jgi:hypothetical protein
MAGIGELFGLPYRTIIGIKCQIFTLVLKHEEFANATICPFHPTAFWLCLPYAALLNNNNNGTKTIKCAVLRASASRLCLTSEGL